MLSRAEDYPAVTLRLFLTYGAGQAFERFIPQVIQGCLRNEAFPVSAGAQSRDFCHVNDVVKAIFNALTAPNIDGEIINIGSGQEILVREVVKLIHRLVGKGDPKFGSIALRKHENPRLFADITKAKSLLNWQPSISLEEGLKTTIKWYAKNDPTNEG